MDYEYLYTYLKSDTNTQTCRGCKLELKKDDVGLKLQHHLQIQSDIGVTCKDDYDLDKLDEEIKELKREKRTAKFRKDGWNRSGVNMLVTACQVTDKEELCLRKKFSKMELGVVVLGLATLVGNFQFGNSWIWMLLGVWILLVLWRLSRTVPAAHIIQQLPQEQQKKLVVKLVDLCIEFEQDPEKLDDIFNFNTTNMGFHNRIVELIVLFLEDADF